MFISKPLTGLAVLLALSSLAHAQPRGPITKGLRQSFPDAFISYRGEGGFANVSIGLDIMPSGQAFAFQSSMGVRKQAWGQMKSIQNQQIRSLVDQLFNPRKRLAGQGSGSMTHTIIREANGVAQYWESNSPQGVAAQLVMQLQSALANVLSTPNTLTGGAAPPVRYLPYAEPSMATGAAVSGKSGGQSGKTGTVPQIIIDRRASNGVGPNQPQGGSLSGGASGSGLAGKGQRFGGKKADVPKIIIDRWGGPVGKGEDGASGLSAPAPGAGPAKSGGRMKTPPQIIVDYKLTNGKTPDLSGGAVKGAGGSGGIEPVDPPHYHRIK